MFMDLFLILFILSAYDGHPSRKNVWDVFISKETRLCPRCRVDILTMLLMMSIRLMFFLEQNVVLQRVVQFQHHR